MFIGILLNVLVSFSVGVISLLTYRRSIRLRAQYPIIPLDSFGYFWLAMFVVWMLIATMDFLSYLTGTIEFSSALGSIPVIIAYGFQIFVGLSVVMIARFINITTLGGARLKGFMAAYWASYGVFLLALFIYGVQPWARNFFARQITGPHEALLVFIAMFAPLWFMGARLFWNALRYRSAMQHSIAQFFLFSSASLLLIGLAGLFDEAGIVRGWAVTAIRLVSMIAAALSYIAAVSLHDSKELVV